MVGGCDDAENILKCLQSKNFGEVLGTVLEGAGIWALSWHAVPDKDFTSDPYLPGEVIDLLESGQFNKDIEIIIGTNAAEGILVLAPSTNGLNEWDEFRI